MSGVIGDVLSVDFHWMLDTSHGADYFRRWHRNKENSGGLMVHKATHHFDLVNWWLSSVPETVFAMGQRRFYTPQQAERYGLTRRTERCLDCPEARLPLLPGPARQPGPERAVPGQRAIRRLLPRPLRVLGPDRHRGHDERASWPTPAARKMSYSLNAFMPWEGYIVAFNGTKGRLEHKCEETVYINGDGTVPGELQAEGTTIRIYPALWRGLRRAGLAGRRRARRRRRPAAG